MRTSLGFKDNLACPDCGAKAIRIGHEYEHADGTISWEDDPVYLSKNKQGQRFTGNELGVVQITVGEREVVRRGQTMTEPITRHVMVVTHVCTNPDCCVAFPARFGRSLT